MKNTTSKPRARLKSVGKVANRNTYPYDAHSVYQISLTSQAQLLPVFNCAHTRHGQYLKETKQNKHTEQTSRTFYYEKKHVSHDSGKN